MDCLVGYGSDDDVETERYHAQETSSVGPSGQRRRDEDNYDTVNMDLSEDSQGAESEPELPPADVAPAQRSRKNSGQSDSRSEGREGDSDRRRDVRDQKRDWDRDRDQKRDWDRDRDQNRDWDRDRDQKRGWDRDQARKNDYPGDRQRDDYDRTKDDRVRDEKPGRPDRDFDRRRDDSRKGMFGDRPTDKPDVKVPSSKTYSESSSSSGRTYDARDAVNPRFVDRDRRDRERERERERERDRHTFRDRRSEEKRSDRRSPHRSHSRERSKPRGSNNTREDRRGSPANDYRPTSYKVNKKLEVMEKMGLQIKAPDGSMRTAQQLRAAAEHSTGTTTAPAYYAGPQCARILDQVQKRKLLWANKAKNETEEAAKWSGAKFSQDEDGKQVNKFMRLMGIKEPAAIKPDNLDKSADSVKKQEELFQAMQAQYEVARATTHTMRGVGLGFQRGPPH